MAKIALTEPEKCYPYKKQGNVSVICIELNWLMRAVAWYGSTQLRSKVICRSNDPIPILSLSHDGESNKNSQSHKEIENV